VPRDATATRSAILTAAVGLLRAGGLSAFSIEGVAIRANVAKGLVLYHYDSRARLLELCAGSVARDRAERLAAAPRGHKGIGQVDAVWQELVRQHEDGTARAWLSLAAHGAFAAAPGGANLVDQASQALLDGCTAALAAGGERVALREAYEALSLALLRLEDEA
jgi:AcrR family transcriptional regulator